MIVFSVMLATYLENLRQKMDERQTAEEFLADLKEDLTHDVAEMKADKKSYDLNRNGFGYFATAAQEDNLKADSLNKYRNIFYSTTALVPNDGGYQGFKSSGKLYSIEDRNLRAAILDLYQEAIPKLLLATDSYTERKKKLIVLYENEFQYQDPTSMGIQKMLAKPITKRLLHSLMFTDEVQERYDQTIALSQKIIRMIDTRE